MSPYLPTDVPLSVTRLGLVLIQVCQSFRFQTEFPTEGTKIYFYANLGGKESGTY